MGCSPSRDSHSASGVGNAINYENSRSPRTLPSDLTPPPLSGVTPPELPDREPISIDLESLPQDYKRLISKAVYVDNLLDLLGDGTAGGSRAGAPKCRCVFVQYKSDVPLAGIAISTISGTLWENVLYPNEPGRPQGIAHLVEHLIYSKPTPDADDVRQWFADRNGDSNACTTDSDMRMWFTVPPKFVLGALRMMLTCMYKRKHYGDKAELEREMLSVDEEYAGMCEQYEVRVVSLLKKICHPANPWHNCFTCGNSGTLSEKKYPDIQDRCLEFHNNILKQQDTNLVIVSSHSVEELIKMSLDCAIESELGTCTPTRDNCKPHALKRPFPLAFHKGKNLPSLLILDAYEWKCEFRFVLPEFTNPMRMQHAMSFISHMFRQQAPGSFLTVLHQKGLTYGVSGCRSYGGFGQNFFDIEFLVNEYYTEEGDPEGMKGEDPVTQGVVWLRLMRRIGRALFTYLKLLAHECAKDPKNFLPFEDFKVIKKFQYQSTAGPDALSLANDIAARMSTTLKRRIDDESRLAEIIIDPAPDLEAEDMAAAIGELVNKHFTIENAICILAGPKFSQKQYPEWVSHRGSWLLNKDQVRADAILRGDMSENSTQLIWETDPWFGTKYTICNLPDKLGEYFRADGSDQGGNMPVPPQTPSSIGVEAAAGMAGAKMTSPRSKSGRSVTASKHVVQGGTKGPSPSCAAAGTEVDRYHLKRHGSIWGAECFDTSFSVQQHNRYLPKEEDLKLRRLESAFRIPATSLTEHETVSVITPSQTLMRVGENELPKSVQLYLHRHTTDVAGSVQVTTRFFLPCLQPTETDVGKIYTRGTITAAVGRSWEDSGFLSKMLLGRIMLRCLANRLRAVSNEAAVAGISFGVNLTSPMNEGQMALELSISGYSGSNTRDLFRHVFESLLGTTEEQLGDITSALSEVKSSLSVQMQNCKYDGRSQLTPNMGLVLIPVSVPIPSQLRVLEQIEKKDVLNFMGFTSGKWTASKMFGGATIVCAIGGNVSVDEAVHDWMDGCLLTPLRTRKVDLSVTHTALTDPERGESGHGDDNVKRLPFHVAVLDLDHVSQLLPDVVDRNNEICLHQTPGGQSGRGEMVAGNEYLYAYNNNDNGRIVQISVNCDTDESKTGLLIVLLKAIEQEFFSWIRDVNNLAYYLSVTFKTVGLDASVLSFAICSTTASLEQLLLCSLQVIDAPRRPSSRTKIKVEDTRVFKSLSRVWESEEAYNDLRDSVVHMLREDSDVEGLDNRHRVLIGGLFSGAHDFDANAEIADNLQNTTYEQMLDFMEDVLKQRSRLVQLSCDPKTAAHYGLQDAEYHQGVKAATFGPNKALKELVTAASRIDQRTWVQLRDPRSLHRIMYNQNKTTKTNAKTKAEFARKPRAYRRGTIAVKK